MKNSIPRDSRDGARVILCALAATFFLSSGIANAGPLTVSPTDHRWFYRDGAPYYFCGPGDPENFFHRGTANGDGTRTGDQQAIISELIGTGANTLWMTAVLSHGGDGGPTENPFIGKDPNLGIDLDALDQWEGWIRQLDAAGIVTFFVFYDDGSQVWNTGDGVGLQEANFVQAIVNRLETVELLVWCIAEEYEEALSPSRISALAALITYADGGSHPIANHQLPSPVFDFPSDTSLDSFAMQVGVGATAPSLHAVVVQAWNLAGGNFNVTMAEAVGQYSDRATSRRLCWAAALGGGAVMVQGLDVAGTPIEALQDCGRLVSFYRDLPLRTMAPRDDLKRFQTEYVFGATGAAFVLYSSNLTGSLGLAVPAAAAGSYNLKWMDCVTGAVSTQTNVQVPAGDRSWTKPPGFGPEVALSLVLVSSATGAELGLESSSWARIKALYQGTGDAIPR